MYTPIVRSPRPRLEIISAVAIVVAAVLPFMSMSISGAFAGDDFPMSSSIALTGFLGDDSGSLAIYLVVLGGATALSVAIYRTVLSWPGPGSAALCMLGFIGFTVGVSWLLLDWTQLYTSSIPDAAEFGFVMTFSPHIGFWAEVAAGTSGAVICLVNLVNPSRPGPGQIAPPYGAWGPWYPPQNYPAQPFGQQYPPPAGPGAPSSTGAPWAGPPYPAQPYWAPPGAPQWPPAPAEQPNPTPSSAPGVATEAGPQSEPETGPQAPTESGPQAG
jgi:hypothetical protein